MNISYKQCTQYHYILSIYQVLLVLVPGMEYTEARTHEPCNPCPIYTHGRTLPAAHRLALCPISSSVVPCADTHHDTHREQRLIPS